MHAMILQCLFCHVLAYVITNGIAIIFLRTSSCTVLLLQGFLLNITPSSAAKTGILSKEKHPLQQLHSKGGMGLFWWAYFLGD